MSALIRPGERLDDLQRGNLRILQRPDGFRFGMDSVLLASFAAERSFREKAIDLGTGSGVLPLLICARVPGVTFDAVEVQPEVADMAMRSVQLNHMDHRIKIHTMDLRDAPRQLGHERYRLAIANPPYGRAGTGPESIDDAHRIARHEGSVDLEAYCRAASALLQNGGRFAIVYPAPRLLELFDAMRAVRLEPKRVRMVHPKYDTPPNIVLAEGVKAAKPMLHFLPPLFIRDALGRETSALKQIYNE